MDDSLTSDTWIESNDGDNFVKGGFLYEKGFWGRKVRRIVLTEKSLRILVPHPSFWAKGRRPGWQIKTRNSGDFSTKFGITFGPQHKRTGIVKKYYSLYSVQNVEAQRCTLVFIVSLYTGTSASVVLNTDQTSLSSHRTPFCLACSQGQDEAIVF